MANFSCGTCQFSTTASDEFIGRKSKCPKCNASGIVVPDVAEPRQQSGMATAINTADDLKKRTLQRLASLEQTGSRDTTLPKWAANIIAITFATLALGTIMGTSVLFVGLGASESAVQEASLSSMFACLFIAAYLIARSIEKVTRAFCRR